MHVGSSPTARTKLQGIFMRKLWYYWAKALGEKAAADDRDADIVAAIRTAIVLVYIITNIVIISGVVHHW